MALFKTENLSFSYPKSDKKALDCINFEIEKGDFVLLMGESGSGKSTLLRLLKKEIAPFGSLSGSIISQSENIAFVHQSPDTSFVSENVRGELAFALENKAYDRDKIAVRIGETASFFNIADILDRDISTLSGGEKATVAVAAAIIDDADTLILDEPFAQLDPKSVISVASMLKRLNTQLGITVIMSSHSSDEVIDFCNSFAVLERGKMIFFGSTNEAVKIEPLLDFFPVYTRLFEERPLTVSQAIPLAKNLRQKEFTPNTKGKTAVQLKNVTFSYAKKDRDILSRLSYSAYSGCINSVIGANGSGKTTLLKLIAGIKKPLGGKVAVNGRVGYMSQNVRYLFTEDTVAQEIKTDTAEKLGISDCLSLHPFDLSAGQAQKLALGILLEQGADIFLLDEPSKAFDERSKRKLAELLKSLCSDGKTVIIVTHDIDFAGEVSDYVSFLSDGVISTAGERRQVFSSLKFYTTQIRRITSRTLESAVSAEDLV